MLREAARLTSHPSPRSSFSITNQRRYARFSPGCQLNSPRNTSSSPNAGRERTATHAAATSAQSNPRSQLRPNPNLTAAVPLRWYNLPRHPDEQSAPEARKNYVEN